VKEGHQASAFLAKRLPEASLGGSATTLNHLTMTHLFPASPQLLYNHLSKFEKYIVTKAQREATVMEAAGRQHIKSALTVRKAGSVAKRR